MLISLLLLALLLLLCGFSFCALRFGSLSSDLVNTRKVGLSSWLSACASRAWIVERAEWQEFLQVRTQIPASLRLEWTPLEIKQVKNAPVAGASATYGVNDLIYIASQLVLLLGMEEQRLLTKVDNMVSSIRLPWEKEATVARPLPLGTVRVHKVDAAGVWRTVCSVPILSGVVCLAFEESTRTVVAGLDDGGLALFRIDARWEDLELLRELRTCHEPKARVTALALHRSKHLLLSAARDKCLAVYDLRTEALLSSTVVGASVGAAAWVSALELDEDAELAFLGTYSQHIHLYDIATPASPKLLHTLEGHTGSVRCMQYRPSEHYLFSGGYDGWAGIWSIHAGSPGSREAVLRSRSVGWLKDGANEKVKSVLFIPPPSAPSSSSAASHSASGGWVVTGQDGGYLCFFSVLDGSLRHASRPHSNTIVKLAFIEDAGVLISAGLDGVVKFWSVPTEPTRAGTAESEQEAATAGNNSRRKRSSGADLAAASPSVAAASPAAASSFSTASSSSSSSSNFLGGPRSLAGGSVAPPPSIASSGSSVLHKASSRDEGAFPSSFGGGGSSSGVGGSLAGTTPLDSRHNPRTSFFQEDDGDLHSGSSSAGSMGKQHSALFFEGSSSSSAAARNLFDSPAPAPSKHAPHASSSASSSTAAVRDQLARASLASSDDAHAATSSTGGAVEIPSHAHEEEAEADIF